jgi:Undecaprenyl-phosphate glucose phosphotransferase
LNQSDHDETEMQTLSSSQLSTDGLVSRGKYSISSNVVPGFIVALDSVIILSVAIISYLVIVGDYTEITDYYIAATIFVWLITVMLMKFADLYQFEAILRPLVFADKIIIAFATTFLFLLAAAFSIKVSATFSRFWMGSFAIGACAATLSFRLLAAHILGRLADMHMFSRNVVVAGSSEQAMGLLAHIEKSHPRFVTLLGLFANKPCHTTGSVIRYPMLGGLDDLVAYVRTHEVDDVIITLPWSADQQIMSIVNKLRELPVNIYLGSDLIGFRLPFRAPPDHFGDMPLVEVMGQPLAGWGILQKAALDYGLGIILTIIFLPVMALIAIAIKLDSKGPVLFRQGRYGFVNNVFDICKFRTMQHMEAPSPCKTLQATRDDPRVTRVGRFLRRMSLDELPQLFNVLNGTMSLVGPRPHAIDHNEEYSQTIRGYFARHRVKPGITGWAQVNGLRGEIKTLDQMEARVKHDIYYTENWSLFFDLKILAMTAFVWLSGRNAY